MDEYLTNYFIEREGNTATDKNPKIYNDHLIMTTSILEQINIKKF